MKDKMNRREFLEQLAGWSGIIWAANLPEKALAEVTRQTGNVQSLNIQSITIPIGLPQPFKVLHISDTHLVRVDGRDDELKRKLAALRYDKYRWAEHCLNAAIEYAKDHHMPLVHTGDMYDFITEANLDLTASYFKSANWITAVGNHEFNIYLQEAPHDQAYKEKSIKEVQSAFPNNIEFSSQVINGVNFISLDNSFFKISEKQWELFEKETARQLPMVLLCHIPFYTPEHCRFNLGETFRVGNMVGAPREVTDTYKGKQGSSYTDVDKNGEWRKFRLSQRADKTTLEFYHWLKENTLLKGILCGHCHHFYQERFSPTAIEYCVGANFRGDAYEVTFN